MRTTFFSTSVKLGLAMILLVTLLGTHLSPARAASFVVDTPIDDALAHDANPGDGVCGDSWGYCTLRAAIEEANALTGNDTITFNGTMSITLSSSEGGLEINDTVQLDASTVWNTAQDRPGVSLSGGDQSFDCLRIYATGAEIYGLHIHSCNNAIDIYGSSNTIGRWGQGQRNVLSNNADAGIFLSSSNAHHNLMQSNWIGLSIAGDAKAPNGVGIKLFGGAHHNDIGGQTAAAGNYISGNGAGVLIDQPSSGYNRIGGNVIGLPAVGTQDTGNEYDGVLITAPNTTIGASPMAPNTIANNGWSGIHIVDGQNNDVFNNTITGNTEDGVRIDGASATGNSIKYNSIYHNGGKGIRLQGNANGGILIPTITSADASSASGTACINCAVQIFSDSEDEGEIMYSEIIADGSGNWSYSGALSGPYITAVNTDVTTGNTSEFSLPFTLAGSNQPPNVPANPSPANQATGVSLTPALSWTGGDPDGDTVNYGLYMADSITATLSLVWSGQSTSHALTQPLLPNHTYYWQINAYDQAEGTTGPKWSFTTLNPGANYQIFIPLVLKH